VTIPERLGQWRVSAGVEAVLLGKAGPSTPILSLATSYAAGDWETVETIGQELDLLEELPEWYAESVGWAREIIGRP